MGVPLSKGGNVSLTKSVPGLKKILIGFRKWFHAHPEPLFWIFSRPQNAVGN